MGAFSSKPEPIYGTRTSPNGWGYTTFSSVVKPKPNVNINAILPKGNYGRGYANKNNMRTRYANKNNMRTRYANKNNMRNSVTFTLFLVRHGISCANVIKAQGVGGFFDRISYTDPELSSQGRKQAIENGPRLQDALRQAYGADHGSFENMIIGSSTMIRAKQTAFLVTHSSFYVVPYVSEVSNSDPFGLSADNKAFPTEEQAKVLDQFACDQGTISRSQNNKFYTPYVSNGGASPNIPKFKQWLVDNYGKLVRDNYKTNEELTPNMLLVTHSGFIKKLYKDIAGKSISSESVKNYSVHAITVSITGRGAEFKDIQEIQYGLNGRIDIQKECEEDTCRKPIGCSTSRKSKGAVCEIVNQEGTLYANLQREYMGMGGTRGGKRISNKTRRKRA